MVVRNKVSSWSISRLCRCRHLPKLFDIDASGFAGIDFALDVHDPSSFVFIVHTSSLYNRQFISKYGTVCVKNLACRRLHVPGAGPVVVHTSQCTYVAIMSPPSFSLTPSSSVADSIELCELDSSRAASRSVLAFLAVRVVKAEECLDDEIDVMIWPPSKA